MVFSPFLEGKWGLSFSFGWFSSLKFFGCMVILAVHNFMAYGRRILASIVSMSYLFEMMRVLRCCVQWVGKVLSFVVLMMILLFLFC